jgi:hypothetical protein
MRIKQLSTVVGTLLGTIFAVSTATASLCQVQTSTFYVKQYCALQARGYGYGQTALGQKALEAYMGGSGATLVGAVGVNSGGSLLSGCSPTDTTDNGFGVFAVGGDCLNAVKFWVQINYY